MLATSILFLAMAAPKPSTALTLSHDPTTYQPPSRPDIPIREYPYTEIDFTKGNGTVEAQLREILKKNTLKRVRYSRALGCTATPLYGVTSLGTPFADFNTTSPWPCGVDIIQITIRHGDWINAIQVTYKSYDGTVIAKGEHGGDGGVLSNITFSPEEQIMAVTGVVDLSGSSSNPPKLLQLTFATKTESGEIKIYGPYGRISERILSNSFLVVGKVDSIFGRSDKYVRSIGFYYEDEGTHS